MRLISLVHLQPEVDAARVVEFESFVAGLPNEVAAVRRAHLGRQLSGQVNAGHYTWDTLIDGEDVGAVLEAPSLLALLDGGDVIERLDSVAFESEKPGIAEPGIANCLKRTLLVRTLPETPAEVVTEFERDILGMPDRIEGIRNWAFSRVDHSLLPSRWTHVWEQEYLDQSGFDTSYMMHPYHWGVVDAWFDPECPQRIIDLHFAHALCHADATILGWQ
ncbi:MAG: Dabb family protein [bacterium]|nr:hypothetical protein [Deltaproteobacteria bacterium]MCP4908771.1 Dabb family protein [bacterium]